MIIERINGLGFKYTISKVNNEQTKITYNRNSIVVRMPFDEVNQAWYNWQMKGMKIQYAFVQLNNEEREFIMTGLTSDDWSRIFPTEE